MKFKHPKYASDIELTLTFFLGTFDVCDRELDSSF